MVLLFVGDEPSLSLKPSQSTTRRRALCVDACGKCKANKRKKQRVILSGADPTRGQPAL
ncbi:hypothetical protein KIN20_034872 [Parelaphostrongylus tenuis]|uniref:Uncharacterized protein n=1 Tax=Parelaphostrongylus tenuis TaxID=148309 RepID=A0AAD5WK24_PARTN|nr:hypothetical protein KIN20_034872 [Parelaphostrongylus tenuis]